MPLNSINTNVGAMTALQVLNGINAELAQVQLRITTGLKVNGPKDNPAVWAIAQGQRGEVRALDSVKGSLNRGLAAVDVAITGAETISELLIEMKAKAVAASEFALTDPSRQALNDEYLALRRQIDTAVRTAEFNGINLISAGGTGQVRALADTRASSTIDVDHVDLSTTGALLAGMPTDLMAGLGPGGIDALSTAMQGVNLAIGRLGTGSKSLQRHLEFVEKQQDTLEAGHAGRGHRQPRGRRPGARERAAAGAPDPPAACGHGAPDRQPAALAPAATVPLRRLNRARCGRTAASIGSPRLRPGSRPKQSRK
jgi:flagellin